MPESASSCGGGAPKGAWGSCGVEQDWIARAQRLVDMPRPMGGYPLALHVEALHVGDLTALAAAVLGPASSDSGPQPR